MMNSRRFSRIILLVVGSLLILSAPSFAQITFERTYGGTNWDRGWSVRQTSDGGYVIAGETNSFGAGGRDFYLIRTDSLGDTLWTATYGGTSDDHGLSVVETSDGGYAVAGRTMSFGAGGWDVYLIRTDTLGDTLWTRAHGGPLNDWGYSIDATSESGFIISGWSWSFDSLSADVYVLHIDSLGSKVWERPYGGYNDDEGYFAHETDDHGCIVCGRTKSYGAGMWDLYLVKTDSLGDTVWTATYGHWANDIGRSVRQTSDGGYIVAGTAMNPGGTDNVYLVRTDSLGDSVWASTYGDTMYSTGYSATETSDGEYVATGIISPSVFVREELYLVKVDSTGETLWTRTYGGANSDRGRSIQETQDGGYIVAGETWSFDLGDAELYLIKTDSDGRVATDATVTSIDSPVDTVFTDSTYLVEATITNLRPSFPTVEVTATMNGYADTVRVVWLAQDSLAQVTFADWQVPSMDSTVYGMTVCVFAADDVDTLNDCRQRTIFAYDPTGVQDDFDRPEAVDIGLWENQPNPLGNSTVVSYSLPAAMQVVLSIHDISGRLVETLVNETQQPGIHQVNWNRNTNPSGVYFCTLRAGEFVETRKMVALD